jgi:DNA-binding NarL/FixJ family response regulator
LALVRNEHFDAVLCDLNLAGVSGVELCEQIWLAAPDLAGRLIVTSGDLSGEGVDGLLRRSGVPPIAKPFTCNDLLRAVGAICPPPRPRGPPGNRRAAS